jgi:tetratricopeptide (TPR) repeat protein
LKIYHIKHGILKSILKSSALFSFRLLLQQQWSYVHKIQIGKTAGRPASAVGCSEVARGLKLGAAVMAAPEMYTQLVSHVKEEQYDEAADLAEEMLEEEESSDDLVRTRVLCLIHLTKLQQALDLIEANDQVDLAIEHAYVLYSLNRTAETIDALSRLERTPAAMHLEAQTRFRMGEYDAVTRIYEELRASGEESADFSANLLAAFASSTRAAEGVGAFQDLGVDTFEGVYNGACCQIAAGNLDEADGTLEAAMKMGQEQLELDDYEEDEIQDELAVIHVQRAYLAQRQGRTDAAMTAYTNVVHEIKATDAAVVAVARNNMVACKGERDLFDGYKHMRAASADSLGRKLNPTQQKIIATNHALVLLLMGKSKEAREEIDSMKSKFPGIEQVCQPPHSLRPSTGYIVPILPYMIYYIGMILYNMTYSPPAAGGAAVSGALAAAEADGQVREDAAGVHHGARRHGRGASARAAHAGAGEHLIDCNSNEIQCCGTKGAHARWRSFT